MQLYTKEQYASFQKFTDPKILVEDITKDLLGIINLPMNGNVQKALEFVNNMIEPTDNYKVSLSRAYFNLLELDMIDHAGNLLPLGRVCNGFNKFSINIAKMCVGGYYLGCLSYIMALGGILSVIMSIEDMFNKPYNMDEDPAIEKAYYDNILKHKHDAGDHITLLIIFLGWLNSPAQNDYVAEHGLNGHTLRQCKTAYEDLMKEVKKAKADIRNLNLFGVDNNILAFGGSRKKYDNNNNYVSSHNRNIKLYHKNIKTFGGNHKPRSFTQSGGKSKKHSNKSHSKGKKQSKQRKPKQPSIKLDPKYARNLKIINLLSLQGLPPGMPLVQPSTVAGQILTALYYGFSTQIASYTGVGNKYNVKFSNIKASIAKSVYDYEDAKRKPDFVIYNEFTVTKTMGRPDDAKLGIVSEIRANEFSHFININELRAKLEK
jgi:HrpA-like RNA helicase